MLLTRSGRDMGLATYSDHQKKGEKYFQMYYIVIHSYACCSEEAEREQSAPPPKAQGSLPLCMCRVQDVSRCGTWGRPRSVFLPVLFSGFLDQDMQMTERWRHQYANKLVTSPGEFYRLLELVLATFNLELAALP